MSVGCSDQQGSYSGHDKFNYHVRPEYAGLRLDHYLVLRQPTQSRSQLTNAIKSGLVTIDGINAKASRRLKTGERISGFVPEIPSVDIIPQEIEFTILFEDEQLLVISKPPHLVVHPGSGNHDQTLVNGLVYHCKTIANVGDPVRPGIVHRLDKDTSGIMVVAKRSDVHRLLVDDFKARKVKKTYHAIVHGVIAEKEGRISAPIGRHPINRKKMAIRERSGKFAVSNWCVERTYGDRWSLVRIGIETGRTHQIRVHMASIGHPVAGDSLYGAGKTNSLFPRQMLHSSELSFNHPVNRNRINIRALFWPDMANVIRVIEDYGVGK